MLIRPARTRVETYCSKVLLKVPRWRRSKFSTAGSCVTPDSAWLITAGEIPAACASADIPPPRRAPGPLRLRRHRRHEGVEIAAAAGGQRGGGESDGKKGNAKTEARH